MVLHRTLPFRMAEGSSLGELEEVSLVSRKTVGIARLRADAVVFEFQITEETMSGLGMGKDTSEVLEVRVPLENVVSVRLTDRWWRRRLTIGTDSLRSFDGIPGAKHGSIQLRISRRDIDAAREISAELEMRLADLTIRRVEAADLEDEFDRLESDS